jgi:hypothetical protein
VDAVEEWIRGHWKRATTKSYFDGRLKFCEKIAATLQPYGSSAPEDSWDNPISLENVTLFKCFANAFKDPADMDKVFGECCTSEGFQRYFHDQHMIATGDFWSWSRLLFLVMTQPAEYGYFVPIPGAFHIGLNAQQGIFWTFRPVILRIWSAVFPRKKLPPDAAPTERKFSLELACEGWKRCRRFCLELVANLDKVPLEAIFLVQLFEEYLPLSLDVYALFLSGDFDNYELALLRLLRMYIQLGKQHYVLCISIFIAQLMHWKINYPALYAEMREKLRYASEEEVEIFHSRVRPHVHWKKDAEAVAREVNVLGANMQKLRAWRPRKTQRTGSRPRAAQLTAERVNIACREIKDLFKQVITSEVPCVLDEKEADWESEVLGAFGDRLLPFALQHAGVRLRGCGGIRDMDREDCDGYIDTGSHRHCGHPRTGGSTCEACLVSTLAVVREMLTHSTIYGQNVVQ